MNSIFRATHALMRILTSLEELLGQIANVFLLAITVGITASAIGRYLFSYPLNSIDQIVTIYLGPGVVLLGAAAALRQNEHISVGFLFDRLGDKAKRICHVFVCLSGIVIFVFIGYQGYLHTRDAFVENQRLVGVVDLWLFPAYVLVPVASALLVARLSVMLFSDPPESVEGAGYVDGHDAEQIGH